jgi:hypothetical protein
MAYRQRTQSRPIQIRARRARRTGLPPAISASHELRRVFPPLFRLRVAAFLSLLDVGLGLRFVHHGRVALDSPRLLALVTAAQRARI